MDTLRISTKNIADENFAILTKLFPNALTETITGYDENNNEDTQRSNVVAREKQGGGYNIYEKYRKTTYKAKTIWDDTDFITEKGTVELGELGLSKYFDFPKPKALIKRCIQLGSGTDELRTICDVGENRLRRAGEKIKKETVKVVAQQKPHYAVFRDSSMANDSVATNFEQIFATYSPETVRKVL